MAENIFAGTEPPAWLSNMARPINGKETGALFGKIIGGVANAVSLAKDKQDQGQDVSWVGELGAGMQEARLNMADPMWRIHAQQAQLNLAGQKLQLDAQQTKIDAQKRTMAWIDHDQQTLPKWLAENPNPEDQVNAQPPDLKSPQFQQAFGKLMQNAIKATGSSVAQKTKTAFAQGLLGVDDPAVLAEINNMPPGKGGLPGPQQIARLNQYRESRGMTPLGLTPAETRAAQPERDTKYAKLAQEIQQYRDNGDDQMADELEGVLKKLGGSQPAGKDVETAIKQKQAEIRLVDRQIEALQRKKAGAQTTSDKNSIQAEINMAMSQRKGHQTELEKLTDKMDRPVPNADEGTTRQNMPNTTGGAGGVAQPMDIGRFKVWEVK